MPNAISNKFLKRVRVNKLQTSVICAHVRHMLKTDDTFEKTFKADPIGVLNQYGLSRTLAVGIMAESKANIGNVASSITDCCCTGSVTINCGSAFWAKLPQVDDIRGWQKLTFKARG